jgi:type IV pilus assembly protein PilQ
MKIRTVMIVTGMMAALIQAQTFKEIQDKPVASPNPEPAVGVTVSRPVSAAPQMTVVVPVAAKPEPAVVSVPVTNLSAVVPADVEVVNVSAAPASDAAMKNGLISLNLKATELSKVVSIFVELSGANIISPELDLGVGTSKVDVNLKNVEWKPALQAILDGKDLELYEKIPSSEVYGVRKKLPAAEAIRNTRTFIFENADIQQASAMITGMVGDRGQVYAYPQGNAVVVKTTQAIMDDVAQIVTRIDQPRKQVLIEARIMELTDGGSNHRGVTVRGNNSGNDKASNPLDGLLTATTAAGLPSSMAAAGTFTLTSRDLQVVLTALETKNNARLVSSPRVIVANGETAKIEIMDRIPKIKTSLTTSTGAGGNETKVTEAKQDEDGTDPDTGRKRYVTYDFGIRLDVTPTVYTEENIGVKIVPIITREDTANTRDVLIGQDANNENIYDKYYAVNEKRVNTTFMLGNKSTAVIGGLTETKNIETESKVPFLGEIPLIRHLFTYRGNEKVQTENIIFVTVSLEDGHKVDMAKAVKQSPLTRKQLVRDENNQTIDDHAVEVFKGSEEARIKEETKINERKEQAVTRDRNLRTPFWNFFRP